MTGDVLTRWVEAPARDRGIHFFLGSGKGFSMWTFDRLAERVQDIASALVARGVQPGDVLAIVAPTSPEFVTLFFAAALAGCWANPLPPPSAFSRDRSTLATILGTRMSVVRPRLVLTSDTLHPAVAAALAGDGSAPECLAWSALVRTGDAHEFPKGIAPGFVQFTSGSTGTPKAVWVSTRNIRSNIDFIAEWAAWTPGDRATCWLPFHHDMGLVGFLLFCVAHQTDLFAMRPEHFVRKPMVWLETIARERATISAAPSFGYAHAARHIDPDRIAALDLSGWRAAFVGSDQVKARDLRAFADALAPAAFRPEAFQPGYGLAESTLAVTGVRAGDPGATAIRISWNGMCIGRPVTVLAQTTLSSPGAAGCDLVSSGVARTGMGAELYDEDGHPVPAGHVGEIVVTGPAVAEQITVDGSRVATRGRYVTGDAGFVHDGELYVLGRLADSAKIAGALVLAEDLEADLHGALGPTASAPTVVFGTGVPTPVHVVVDDALEPPVADLLREKIADRFGDEVSVHVAAIPRADILRTPSGKPRRRALLEILTAEP